MKTSTLLIAKVSILKLPPEAWDAIIPQGLQVSRSLIEYMAAGVVRDIALLVRDPKIGSQIREIGREMVSSASGGLINGWESGDDICPPGWPWPRPRPRPWPWWEKETKELEPVFWKIASVEQGILADLLMSLSEIPPDPDLGYRLRSAASAIIGDMSRHLEEDFYRAQESYS